MAAGRYDRAMTGLTIGYSVGNEHNPSDPWGRSELVIQADGSARLDHIDAVIRQLSGDTVRYPTRRGPVVHGAAVQL